MSTKNLQKILEGLAGSTEDIEASALISQDGLVVASTLHQPIDEGRLGTVLATMLSLGRDAAKELAKGGLEQILIQGRGGQIVLVAAGEEAILAVTAKTRAKFGLLFLDIRRAAQQLSKELA